MSYVYPSIRLGNTATNGSYIFHVTDVAEWSMALDIRLSDWYCSIDQRCGFESRRGRIIYIITFNG